MTVHDNMVIWDNGESRLCVVPVDEASQYRYMDGRSCVTFEITYESARFKGCDCFTLFDNLHGEFLRRIQDARQTLAGNFRLTDAGADTDGYVDFAVDRRDVVISGRLGASFSDHSLCFSFHADQTVLQLLECCLTI